MRPELIISIIALVLAVIALGATAAVYYMLRKPHAAQPANMPTSEPASATALLEAEASAGEILDGPPHVIYNPSKTADWRKIREELVRAADAAGLPEPVWIKTTEEDPGFGQARHALDNRACVVIAAGGDGTVRAVAQVLAGTSTPLGIMPVGTGNLLARNLDFPIQSIKDLAQIALTGINKCFDVGRINIEETLSESQIESQSENQTDDGSAAPAGHHAFMVMGGVGFDADLMDSTKSELKDRIGWLAYVQAAGTHLFSSKLKAQLQLSANRQPVDVEARSVMFLNCGELTGGIVLEPHADPADQWLDLAVLDVRGGILGWFDLARRVILKGIGFQAHDLIKQNVVAGHITTRRIRECRVALERPQQLQLDGDVLGVVQDFTVEVLPQSLYIRTRH
ncbi:diacylglycerol/lipid kinase family protein [Arcanobacterium bovis]|uniref:Diacylglycerol kinase n=1 Tax=Arcanobacterium bovis TaxID=2529275 RepID=A0A4Q9V2I2_9ACTO|nr:diacylglycerol kinase family protein [Arcanobacterium bovis]TBW23865.1 diacylglycerol kinase [Arcanobacterium bovis]